MSEQESLWFDLTVEDAVRVRDFYVATLGWTFDPMSMDAYDDFVMKAKGTAVAGICHARGPNEGFPPVWLPYFEVDSLKESLAICQAQGGTQVTEVRSTVPGMKYVVIRDPAGACAALFERV